MLDLVTQGQVMLDCPLPSSVLRAYYGQLLLKFADSSRLTAHWGFSFMGAAVPLGNAQRQAVNIVRTAATRFSASFWSRERVALKRT